MFPGTTVMISVQNSPRNNKDIAQDPSVKDKDSPQGKRELYSHAIFYEMFFVLQNDHKAESAT